MNIGERRRDIAGRGFNTRTWLIDWPLSISHFVTEQQCEHCAYGGGKAGRGRGSVLDTAVIICTAGALEYPYVRVCRAYTYSLIGTSVSETIHGLVAISDNARVHMSKGYALAISSVYEIKRAARPFISWHDNHDTTPPTAARVDGQRGWQVI